MKGTNTLGAFKYMSLKEWGLLVLGAMVSFAIGFLGTLWMLS